MKLHDLKDPEGLTKFRPNPKQPYGKPLAPRIKTDELFSSYNNRMHL